MDKDVKNTINKAADVAQDAADKASDAVKNVANKGVDVAKDVADQAKGAANKGADAVKDAADKAGEHFEDFAGIAEDEFSRLYGEEGKLETFVNFMRDRPVLAVGVAAVGGVVFLKILKCLFGRRK